MAFGVLQYERYRKYDQPFGLSWAFADDILALEMQRDLEQFDCYLYVRCLAAYWNWMLQSKMALR